MNAYGLVRLGRDAELRTTGKGDTVATLALAFTRRVNGEKLTLRAKATVTPEQEQELRDTVAQAQQSTIDQDTGEIAHEADAEYTQTEE